MEGRGAVCTEGDGFSTMFTTTRKQHHESEAETQADRRSLLGDVSKALSHPLPRTVAHHGMVMFAEMQATHEPSSVSPSEQGQPAATSGSKGLTH